MLTCIKQLNFSFGSIVNYRRNFMKSNFKESYLMNRPVTLQGAAKKMTQHQKCDNSVRLENFCTKCCVIV